ncbi:MAG: class I SAM-dependent methyltransferase [Actinobacteria bacterium]|nr:class I SAM-dependent methyltransferase [Actinomycetota bacterium]
MASPDSDLIYHHFSTVAARYNDLRTTDPEPVDLMARRLVGLPAVTAADVGCGTGRYAVELMRRLGDRLFVHFIDCNEDMLEQVRLSLSGLGVTRFGTSQSRAELLPLPNGSLDYMLTFNAVHHFDLVPFLHEAARTLRPGGLLFIYTRFRSHNERGIWGRYFPRFTEKETRLHEEEDLVRAISSAPGLEVRDVTHFGFCRAASLGYLLERVRNNHYSTFCFYEPAELARAAEGFEVNLRADYHDPETIEWVDENVMFTVERL